MVSSISGVKELPEVRDLIVDPVQRYSGAKPDPSSEDFQRLGSVVAAVYRSVFIKSVSCAQLDVIIERKKGDTWEDISDSDELTIFKTYNDRQTDYDFWEQFWGYMEYTGECPIALGYNGVGKLEKMFPLRPDLIEIIPGNESIVDHYIFHRGGKFYTIAEEDILFVKYFNPLNTLRGLSPISAAKNDLILELGAIAASKNLFEKGMVPSGIISTDKELDDAKWKRYTTAIQEKYGGTVNFGKMLVLGDGMSYKQLSLSSKEMQFMELREWTRDTVSMVYGLPPIFLMNFSSSSVLQNTEIQYKLLWETLKPNLIKVQKIFTAFVLPLVIREKNVRFRFDLSKVAALQDDIMKKTKRFESGFKQAATSPNDFREHVLGLARVPDSAMDQYYLQGTVIPISNIGEEPEKSISTTIDNFISKHQRKIDLNGVRDSVKELFTKREKDEIDLYRIKTLAQIQNSALRQSKKFAKIILKLFDAIEKDVLGKIDGFKFLKSPLNVNAIFDFKKWVKEFEAAGKPFIAEALRLATIDLARELVETTIDLTHPDIQGWVNTQSRVYATITNTTTRDQIDTIIKQGLTNNLSIEEIALKLKNKFTAQATMRSERIARTEMLRATNKGRLEGMKASPSVTHHVWVTQRDDDVRDGHAAVDGVVVKVGANFPVGAGYNGDPTYPSDIFERCGTLAVKKKKSKYYIINKEIELINHEGKLIYPEFFRE